LIMKLWKYSIAFFVVDKTRENDYYYLKKTVKNSKKLP